jgi:hypothetical protein
MLDAAALPTITPMSYAVVWSKDDGPMTAGKLELVNDVIQLQGANGHAVDLSVPLNAITRARIGRTAGERLHGRPVLMLDLGGGRRMRITTLSGVGALHELADAIGAR